MSSETQKLNWLGNDYFVSLMLANEHSHSALEMLVDDLHTDKERTISQFLCHSGSEDFLWGLIRLLGDSSSRVAGNSAYIIGTLAESEFGCYRVLSLITTSQKKTDGRRVLDDLTKMLAFDDAESVMNAAGTIGTLAETHEGRQWMMGESCLIQMIDNITHLLINDNIWTASNAALVLARVTIAEEGCFKLLEHSESQSILSQLIQSLGVDEAGRGMNAAFAIGRLCDMDIGRTRLLGMLESEKMITSLAKMLSCSDLGASKNACFAISCLATTPEGHARLLNNIYADDVIKTLGKLLPSEDNETGWFAAMTLRTVASQPRGCMKLRDNGEVVKALKLIIGDQKTNSDLKEEAKATLEILKRLEKPLPPNIEVKGPHVVEASWSEVTTRGNFPVRYQLYEGEKVVYYDREPHATVKGLQPFSQYSFKIRAITEGDESPLSETITITTEESVPGPPTHLRMAGSTTTQLKVVWEPPDVPNGILKGYYVYQGRQLVESTYELSSIITGLQPSTSYEIQVCASTAKGKGPKSIVCGTTSELGAHAPDKPTVTVLGRNEVHVLWSPPENPIGKINRYDLTVNGKNVYSGTDLSYTVRRLNPDTEYAFVVSALTNEGRCDSKPTKKKTSKDEYDDGNRQPLYPQPKKEKESPPRQKSAKRRKSSVSNLAENKELLRRNSAQGKRQSISEEAEKVVNKAGPRPPSSGGSSTSHQRRSSIPKEDRSERLASAKSTKSISESVTPSTIQLPPPVPSPHHIDYTAPQYPPHQRLHPSFQEPLQPIQFNREGSSMTAAPGIMSIKISVKNTGSRKKTCVTIGDRTTESSKSTSRVKKRSTSDIELTRSMTTLNLGLKTQQGIHHKKYLDPVTADLKNKRNGQILQLNPDMAHRTNTFIGSHRPNSKKGSKSDRIPPKQLTPPGIPTPPPGLNWQPKFPAPPMTFNNNAKFVPMQFRTQPANLPSTLRRELTSVGVYDKAPGLKKIDAVTRSNTQADMSRSNYESEQRYAVGNQKVTSGKPSSSASSRKHPSQLYTSKTQGNLYAERQFPAQPAASSHPQTANLQSAR
ncbi:uncharacterized protein LOC135501149 isoform X2 [Lineus longissimus]|uniref:uncharacterized protein LOC135501149 isoform X2 n=1 Tax=Lineus longissimus TaxID=88925 RepID=UPI00315DC6D5